MPVYSLVSDGPQLDPARDVVGVRARVFSDSSYVNFISIVSPAADVARVLPTDNTARDQVVQYKDVGTKLQIVPTISDDGFVMLQVTQEINVHVVGSDKPSLIYEMVVLYHPAMKKA